MFRGREVAHPERGEMILNRLAEELGELAIVEQRPQQDGRNMTMMLAPVEGRGRRRATGRRRPSAAEARRSRRRALTEPPPRARPTTRPRSTPDQASPASSATGLLYCSRSHAEDEDPLRRQEALQVTATGKVRARHAFSSHILEKKSPKRKRHFRKAADRREADAKRVKKLLGRQGR